MSDHPFITIERFQQAFTSGLSGLLQKGGLGPFILVCANASFDKRVEDATSAELAALYKVLSTEYIEAFSSGKQIQAVEEDLLVFLKLHALGFSRLQATETRRVGPWEVQFNQLRSFRPRRISSQVPETLHVPFDEAGFHFNKPFMQKEAFWAGELNGRHATLYYNKYPFVDLHGLLVPEREQCLPQFLTEAQHFYVWQMTQDLSRTLQGVGFGYNSLGAFASVNHLHFQMFVKPAGLPVMDLQWQHNGGITPYPTTCLSFDDPAAAWVYLVELNKKNIPYNLLYSQGRLFIFPRKKQGCYAQPDWTSGFAWHEMAGGMITFNRESYESLDQEAISQELGRLVIEK
jgi:diadenosine tetraphosphate (Ap4A) HIT family hydrolase